MSWVITDGNEVKEPRSACHIFFDKQLQNAAVRLVVCVHVG